MVSIIIPTYNEAENIEDLIKAFFDLQIKDLAVVIVDDNSPDGTGQIAEKMKINFPFLKVIHRAGKLGLGSAVVDGFEQGQGQIFVVADADFSHDYKIIPQMIRAIEQDGFDLVIGSRYIKGGGTKNWPLWRKLASRVATLIARIFLRIKVKDPMSGFFAMRKICFNNLKNQIDAKGFKILLEILVRAKNLKIKEIPYVFIDRKKGQSKFNGKIIKEYLQLIRDLRRI